MIGLDLAARGLANARAAAGAVSAAVADRRLLTDGPDDDGEGSLARLTRAECLVLLAGRRVGRYAYVARQGVPDVVPVTYALHDGALLLRSGPGPKLQAAERGEVVAVEVDDVDEERRTGWSVVVAGRAARLRPAEVAALPAGVVPEPWARGPRSHVVRVPLDRVQGRVLR